MTEQAGPPDQASLIALFREMVTIREFEEQVMRLYQMGKIPGIAHVSIGQEAVPVGVCAALNRDDYITSTHRGHGHCLAKGASPDRMFTELFGKVDGYCRGKGGSMHIADPDTGNLGANAIVGGSLAIAAGAGLNARLQGKGQVAVCFFGDGALNQGLMLESMNIASIWKLPVIYVCENNQYGVYTATEAVTAGDIIQRGQALGIRSTVVDGMDVLRVREAAHSLVAGARQGEGPAFLMAQTYRYQGHGMSDSDRPYREREEEQIWAQRDPIRQYNRYLIENGHSSEAEMDGIVAEIKQEIEAAIAFGEAAPYPTADEVTRHVFAN
jgi:pyruvate dehydrogenase E1 component alpha subunit